MPFSYTIADQFGVYFVTFTVHQWVDVFTKKEYVDEILNNLIYCQENKGLTIYGWVIMSNHIQLIISAKNGNLSDIIRDYKKFTAKKIFKMINENEKENRKNWLTKVLSYENNILFWRDGYQGEEILTKEFFDNKLDIIHHNPVMAGMVEKEEEYILSSAGDYYGIRKGRLQLSIF